MTRWYPVNNWMIQLNQLLISKSVEKNLIETAGAKLGGVWINADRLGKSQSGHPQEDCYVTELLKFFKGITQPADKGVLVYIICIS